MKGVVLRQLGLKTLFTIPGYEKKLKMVDLAATMDLTPRTHGFSYQLQTRVNLDGGARGMATGADVMCGRIQTGFPTKPKDGKTRTQAAESLTSSIINAVSTPAVEVEVEVPVTPQGSSWTSKQKWWRPDPATGTWVPEGHEGQVTTSTDATKSASQRLRVRSETSASIEDKLWWTSMEELPDMDRAK